MGRGVRGLTFVSFSYNGVCWNFLKILYPTYLRIKNQYLFIGIIHHNCTPQYQASEVMKVKKYQHGFVLDPYVLSPEHTVQDVLNCKQTHGFCGIPITENGRMGGKLVGIVTSRDIDFIVDKDKRKTPLKDVMTPFQNMVTEKEGISLKDANQILVTSKKGKLPIINERGKLNVTVKRHIVKRQKL